LYLTESLALAAAAMQLHDGGEFYYTTITLAVHEVMQKRRKSMAYKISTVNYLAYFTPAVAAAN